VDSPLFVSLPGFLKTRGFLTARVSGSYPNPQKIQDTNSCCIITWSTSATSSTSPAPPCLVSQSYKTPSCPPHAFRQIFPHVPAPIAPLFFFVPAPCSPLFNWYCSFCLFSAFDRSPEGRFFFIGPFFPKPPASTSRPPSRRSAPQIPISAQHTAIFSLFSPSPSGFPG